MTAAPDLRHRAVAALARARSIASLPEAYFGQESFVSATEILALARAAGVGEGRASSTSAAASVARAG